MEQVQEISMPSSGGAKQPWLAKHWQKLVAAGLWIAIVGTLIWFMRSNGLTLSQVFLIALEWVQTSPMAPLAYIVIYAIRPLTLFSSALLTIAGGFLFGPTWGIVYTIVGANLSATVAYFVGRYFGQGVLEEDDSEGLIQRYANRMRNNSFETILIMRFVFIPYDLVNYLAGFLHIAYGPFILATIIGSLPGTFAFVLLGASLSTEAIVAMFETGTPPSLDWRVLALSVIMFVTSIALSRYFKRRERATEPPA